MKFANLITENIELDFNQRMDLYTDDKEQITSITPTGVINKFGIHYSFDELSKELNDAIEFILRKHFKSYMVEEMVEGMDIKDLVAFAQDTITSNLEDYNDDEFIEEFKNWMG